MSLCKKNGNNNSIRKWKLRKDKKTLYFLHADIIIDFIIIVLCIENGFDALKKVLTTFYSVTYSHTQDTQRGFQNRLHIKCTLCDTSKVISNKTHHVSKD